jgi:transposase
VRPQSQLECLLEEGRIKLSSVITDLLGVSGRKILRALALGETDAERLADLGHERLRCSRQQLIDAVSGKLDHIQCQLPALYLDRIDLLDKQMQAERDGRRLFETTPSCCYTLGRSTGTWC